MLNLTMYKNTAHTAVPVTVCSAASAMGMRTSQVTREAGKGSQEGRAAPCDLLSKCVIVEVLKE